MGIANAQLAEYKIILGLAKSFSENVSKLVMRRYKRGTDIPSNDLIPERNDNQFDCAWSFHGTPGFEQYV